MRVSDLIQIPVRQKVKTTTRRAVRKVPSWHLTSDESMQFIAESHERTTAKETKAEEEAKVKHEAVLAHRRKKRQPVKRKK